MNQEAQELINQARKHLNQDYKPGYFEAMGKLNLPENLKDMLASFRRRFIMGDTPYDFSDRLREFIGLVVEELQISPEPTAVTDLEEIKQKLDLLTQKVDESHRKLVTEIVDKVSAENAELLEQMYQSLDNLQVNPVEANQLIASIQQYLPAKLPNKDALEKELASMNVTQASKLKLIIPIIPTMLQYETEIGTQWAQSIPQLWRSWVNTMRKRLPSKR